MANKLIFLMVLCLIFLGTFIYYNQLDKPLSPEEEIDIAIQSYKLSSYGWDSQQDEIAATLTTSVFIKSKLIEMGGS